MDLKSFRYKFIGWILQVIAFASWYPWSQLIMKYIFYDIPVKIVSQIICWLLLFTGVFLMFMAYNCLQWSVYYDRDSE